MRTEQEIFDAVRKLSLEDQGRYYMAVKSLCLTRGRRYGYSCTNELKPLAHDAYTHLVSFLGVSGMNSIRRAETEKAAAAKLGA